MSAQRYRVTVGGQRAWYKQGKWGTGPMPGVYRVDCLLFTAGQAAKVKRACDRIGATCHSVPSTAPRATRAAKKKTGRKPLSKRAFLARMAAGRKAAARRRR